MKEENITSIIYDSYRQLLTFALLLTLATDIFLCILLFYVMTKSLYHPCRSIPFCLVNNY